MNLHLNPRTGAVARRDDAVEVMVCKHGESRSGLAWLVSPDGDVRNAVWLPKALVDLSEPCGGFERMDANCQRALITIHEASMPAFKAREKGLIA